MLFALRSAVTIKNRPYYQIGPVWYIDAAVAIRSRVYLGTVSVVVARVDGVFVTDPLYMSVRMEA